MLNFTNIELHTAERINVAILSLVFGGVITLAPYALAQDQSDPFDTLATVSVFFSRKPIPVEDFVPDPFSDSDSRQERLGADVARNVSASGGTQPSGGQAIAPSRFDAEGLPLVSLATGVLNTFDLAKDMVPLPGTPTPKSRAITIPMVSSLEVPGAVQLESVSDVQDVYADLDNGLQPSTTNKSRPLTAGGRSPQYERALNRRSVGTTFPDADIGDLAANPPNPEGGILTLKEVLIYTLTNNPDIGIALWQTEDARYAIRVAKAPFLPTVDLNASTGLENNYIEDAGGTNGVKRREAGIRFTQRLYDFGRSAQLLKRVRALHQSSELAYNDTVESTVFSAVNTYLILLGATEQLENALANVKEHEDIFRLVEINYEGGNTSEASLRRAQTRLDRARTASIDAENFRETAINDFRRVTGLQPDLIAEPSIDVSQALVLNDQTVDDILTANFELQSFVRDGNSIKHQIKAARRTNLPEFTLELFGRYQDNVLGNTEGSTEGRAMLTARWNLYDGGATSSRVKQLRAREKENQQRVIKLRNELRQEAANIITVLRTTNNKRQIFDEQVVSSRRVVELYSKEFEAGRRTLLELLDAQADFAEAREGSIANKYENLSASFASLRFQNNLTPILARELGFSADNGPKPSL